MIGEIRNYRLTTDKRHHCLRWLNADVLSVGRTEEITRLETGVRSKEGLLNSADSAKARRNVAHCLCKSHDNWGPELGGQ